MNMPANDEVQFERVGEHVAVVTLNRPAARNAVNGAVARTLESLVAQVEADKSIRVAVLAAAGSTFCAGVDLKTVAAGNIMEVARPQTGFAGFVYAPKSKPWIAAVQGPAMGGGVELALSCDLVVAGEAASFAFPEVKRGLIAGAAGAYRITRCLSRPLAIEMIVTGEPLGARRAYEVGLVNRVTAQGAEREEALTIATLIATNSPVAVRESLRVTRYASDLCEAEIRAVQDDAVARVLSSSDYQEGAKAFVERRAPVWSS
ncbi:enoyl-CoA hydratase-related protein [Povalibacter sp.]|uniref:enoyl-CoA hydratase-related protein n=1 Tax=Povalibacter sp. TaxID=1962978 RepID=UPI002F3F763F